MKRTALVFSALMCIMSLFAQPHRILFLSSYHPDFPTFSQQVAGLEDTFSPATVLDIEFMDSKRFPDMVHDPRYLQYLSLKLHTLPPYDIIITADDNALRFVRKHRRELFADIPLVFFGVNNLFLARDAAMDGGITGVIEAVSMAETIECISTLYPEATTLYAVVDDTASGQGDLSHFLSLRKQFPSLQLTPLSLENLSFKEMSDILNTLDTTSAVLLLSAYHDRTGATLLFHESVNLLFADMRIPVFHLWYHGIGDGLLGGKVISHYSQAVTAAHMAEKILAGAAADTMALVEQSPNLFIFDAELLTKFDLHRWQLPRGAQLINDENAQIRRYWYAILLILAFMVLEALLIARLIITRRSLRQNMHKLTLSEERYRRLYNGIHAGLLTIDAAGVIHDNNSDAAQLLDRSVLSLMDASVYQLFSSQAEKLKSYIALVVANKSSYTIELASPANPQSWLSLTISPYESDQAEQHIQVFIHDITRQKQVLAQMHEREEQYHLLLDTSPDAILIFDEHDTISELNSQAAHLLGYTTDQLKGQPLSRIASGLNLHASSYTAQQHRPAIDHRFIHRDGSIVPVEISVAAFSQHQQRFFICAARDTTERNALKEQLLEHQQQLESKIAQRSRELAEAIETLTQRNADLERMNKLFIGREFRIKELKDTIQRLTAAADDARQ